MFKLPGNAPEQNAKADELADFVEFQCLVKGQISLRSALKPVFLISDEINVEGIEDENDGLSNRFDEVGTEIEKRRHSCNSNYPFFLKRTGYSIEVDRTHPSFWPYIYLLLSTRLNMTTDHKWNGIDGAKILEKVSAAVLVQYFGGRAKSMVFGTAVAGGFEEKVNDLCQKIGEGIQYFNRNYGPRNEKDDKLDVVVWTDFTDKRQSKVIGFGQCKTGTSWDDRETIELQPVAFCKKWFRDQPVHDPIKIFFSSQYFPIDQYSKLVNAGIVFDRFRIMDYFPVDMDTQIALEIQRWCEGALEYLQASVMDASDGKMKKKTRKK